MSRSDDDAFNFGHSPVRDALAGPTTADNQRHVIARAVFLRHMLTDDRVIGLFAEWRDRIGADSAEDALKRMGAVYERLTGLDWRDQAAPHPTELECTAEEVLILERGEREAAALFVAADGVPFADDAISLTKAAGVTWAWLPAELIKAFWLDVVGRALSRKHVVTLWAEEPDPPVKAAEFRFATREGETVRQARARFQEASAAFDAVLDDTAAVPAGRSVNQAEVASIERDVAWFYRTRVKAPRDRVARLARASDIKADDPRRSVYDAIDRARLLLGYGRFELQ